MCGGEDDDLKSNSQSIVATKTQLVDSMNVRLSLLLIVVLALIGGSVFITRELSTKEPKKFEPWLFKLDTDDIIAISVDYQGSHMGYARQEEGWVIKDGADTPVFNDKWAGTPLLLSGPRVQRALLEQTEDLTLYGLDSPQTEVRIETRSGITTELELGDPTPDGSNWYVKLKDTNQLFTLPSIWAEVVSKLAIEPPYAPTPVPGTEESST